MRGSSASARPGGWKRFGPANETGEARSPNTGSVSTWRPPFAVGSCTSTVAWPMKVAVGRIGCAVALARSSASSGLTTGGGASGAFGRPLNHDGICQRTSTSMKKFLGWNST